MTVTHALPLLWLALEDNPKFKFNHTENKAKQLFSKINLSMFIIFDSSFFIGYKT